MKLLRRSGRAILEGIAQRFGYKMCTDGLPPRGFDNFLKFVKSKGFAPKTVFDIGVGYGTPWLYRAFSDAHFVLLEPLTEFKPYIDKLCTELDAECHFVGAGQTKTTRAIFRPEDSPTGSSFLPRTERQARTRGELVASSEVLEIIPLDHFEYVPGPIALKIDTEGFERDVLLGAGKILERTELILIEVAVNPRHQGEADIVEVATLLKERGFAIFDIPELSQESANGRLAYIDIAFAHESSQLWT